MQKPLYHFRSHTLFRFCRAHSVQDFTQISLISARMGRTRIVTVHTHIFMLYIFDIGGVWASFRAPHQWAAYANKHASSNSTDDSSAPNVLYHFSILFYLALDIFSMQTQPTIHLFVIVSKVVWFVLWLSLSTFFSRQIAIQLLVFLLFVLPLPLPLPLPPSSSSTPSSSSSSPLFFLF